MNHASGRKAWLHPLKKTWLVTSGFMTTVKPTRRTAASGIMAANTAFMASGRSIGATCDDDSDGFDAEGVRLEAPPVPEAAVMVEPAEGVPVDNSVQPDSTAAASTASLQHNGVYASGAQRPGRTVRP